MKLTPRPYQQEAHDAVVAHWKRSLTSCVIEAATGSGKSVIVAMLAKTLHDISGGKRVLCLAPSKELIEQNAEKYRAIGEVCSIYSASAGRKDLTHQVIFATEGTFKSQAERLGSRFAGVIIDECHRITPTIKNIIADMKKGNPNLRVCGLSATPYRMLHGFIYGIDENDKAIPEWQTFEPYFYKCVYKITARTLLDMGFLTPLIAGDINAKSYDTSGLKIKPNGQFDAATVKAAFEGWGRETAAIIADVVAQTQNATGVMIFAATVNHAHEIMASLHPDNSRMITGTTKKAEREQTLEEFKAGKFMYLVNVSVLTTGFDAANVSHIAILRATESVSLLQQIFGRGMRLFAGKKECVILDYARNIEKHMPDGDLYAPEIYAKPPGTGGEPVECRCEECNRINVFSSRPNEDGFGIDENGYFIDMHKLRIETEVSEGVFKYVPAHYGRRCVHENANGERCAYFWSNKECPVCETDNDIAARFCRNCKSELVNPNDRLILLHKQHKKDPTLLQTDELLEIYGTPSISRAGNEMLVVDVVTSRRRFTTYYPKVSPWQVEQLERLEQVTENFTKTPRTISYLKDGDFWKIKGFNAPTDEEVLNEKIGHAV